MSMVNMISGVSMTFSKKEIIEHLRNHLKNHEETYAQAREVYLHDLKRSIAKAGAQVREGKIPLINTNFGLIIPVDQSSSYRNMINIFEKSSDSEVKLDAEEAHNIINDSWSWAQHASALNSTYSARHGTLKKKG